MTGRSTDPGPATTARPTSGDGEARSAASSRPRSTSSRPRSAWWACSPRPRSPAGATGLAAARLVVGAAFLGVVTDAMLLGHWYLTQPGLPRDPIKELVRWAAYVWPVEVLVFLLPPGMVGVISGAHDDGYGGLLGWMWVVCAITTGALLVVTWLALRERSYSAVMAATGLLYLAILTAFGTDLVARALLAP